MNNQILKAQNKKKKWLEMNDDSSDTDGSLTSDDEDEISEGIVGNIFDNTYLCIKYLGRGTFSRVWLVYNLKDNKYYAMKMQLPEFYDDAMYEIKILRMLGTEDSNIGKLYHVFSHKDNDTDKYYYCLIIELLGESLLSLYDTFQDERIPLKVIKTIIKDVFMGLDECHSKNIIHTDLKPENILITKYPKHIDNIINWFNSLKPLETINLLIEKMLPDDYEDFNKNKKKNLKRKIRDKSYKIFSDIFLEKLDEYYTLEIDNDNDDDDDGSDFEELYSLADFDNIRVKIVDFGNGEIVDKLEQDVIGLRSYRCPENIIDGYYNTKADIWMVGCILYELLTNQDLFSVNKLKNSLDRDREHLYQMYNIFGKMPKDMVLNCKYAHDYFDNKGRILKNKNIEPRNLSVILKGFDYNSQDIENIICFMKHLFCYDINDRYSANQCLKHSFLS